MADDVVSFYPPDFPLEITNITTGAHTLDVLRLGGKKTRIVARLHLKVGDEPTPHGKVPDASSEEIAADLWNRMEEDAKKHCKGFARYRIVATYSKPKSGPTGDPQSFEIEVGDPPLPDLNEARRDGIFELQQSLLSARHREYIELARETTKLAQAVGQMGTGLASAWSTVHEKQGEQREHALELAVLSSEREGERERLRLLEKSLVPMLKLLQGKRGAPLALEEADHDKPEIIRVARKLGASFTGEQLDSAAKILGADRLRELASIENEADLLALIGWLVDNAHVLDVYAELRDDQVPMVDRLQNWAADEGEKHAASKAS